MQNNETDKAGEIPLPPFNEFVRALAMPGEDIARYLMANPDLAHLLHMAGALCGEAGELFDAVKRAAIYQQPLDVKNCLEELGDLAFFTQGILNHLGITQEEVIAHNVAKLRKRYEKGFSTAAAKARADKAEENRPAVEKPFGPFKLPNHQPGEMGAWRFGDFKCAKCGTKMENMNFPQAAATHGRMRGDKLECVTADIELIAERANPYA